MFSDVLKRSLGRPGGTARSSTTVVDFIEFFEVVLYAFCGRIQIIVCGALLPNPPTPVRTVASR